MKSDLLIRKPAVADQFYPANPKDLRKMIHAFLDVAQKSSSSSSSIAFLVPHAGYVFSGAVAAYAYKQIEDAKIDTVILIGLAHSYPLDGAAVYPKGVFRSPLGDVPIDEETVQKLLARSKDIESNPNAHAGEHSLETQIPFLQEVLKNFKLVPIVMGNPDLATAKQIGESIADIVSENESKGKRTLIIGSTDMAHYPNEKFANESDQAILKTIEDLNSEMLVQKTREMLARGIPELHVTLCGEGAAIAVMTAAKKLGAAHGIVLKHATSADSPFGDKSRTVGYGAVMFEKEEGQKLFGMGSKEAFAISAENQKRLLQDARAAIERYLIKGEKPKIDTKNLKRELATPSAVFVTLTKQGDLRGCIGTIEAEKPLALAVQDYAIAAATQDPRFSKLAISELNSVKIEISVLSPITKIKSHEEIIPNVNGVIVERDGHRGLFLPQVWEHVNGNKEEFMNLLCSEKAGLPENAWKDPSTQLSTFTVFSFEE